MVRSHCSLRQAIRRNVLKPKFCYRVFKTSHCEANKPSPLLPILLRAEPFNIILVPVLIL